MASSEIAADLRGPKGGSTTLHPDLLRFEISALNITTSTQVIDMSDTNHFGGDHYTARFVRIICDQNIFYYWSPNSGAVLDETKKDGTNREQQCDLLPALTPREEVPAGRYFVVKGAAAGTARLSIVNQMSP